MLRERYIGKLAEKAHSAEAPGQEIVYRVFSEILLKEWGPGNLLEETGDMTEIEKLMSRSIKTMDGLDALEEEKALAYLPVSPVIELREKFIDELFKLLRDTPPYNDMAILTLENGLPEEYTRAMAEIRKAIPDRIKIGDCIVPVFYGPHELITHKGNGQYDRENRMIRIRGLDYFTGKPRSLAEVYSTFLHEVSHAYDHLKYGDRLMKLPDHGERIIQQLVNNQLKEMQG